MKTVTVKTDFEMVMAAPAGDIIFVRAYNELFELVKDLSGYEVVGVPNLGKVAIAIENAGWADDTPVWWLDRGKVENDFISDFNINPVDPPDAPVTLGHVICELVRMATPPDLSGC